ncbi:transcription initiation factor IIE subunit alpha-like [Heracleum sosnowskyi]|uniref:Transcription initiation factor IIE subunit alpha-like n=1 Tax=Heracleum sosnowskyi TaxID=360622 RepID=A0AAD8H8Q0_9APIA|nr:transcription initiation factor IIE subunit alpha-like [Heracleum sosnowskyi]
MNYVEQYVLAKSPEYSNVLVEGGEKTDLYDLCIKEEPSHLSPDDKRKSPRGGFRDSVAPSFGSNHPDFDKTQLEPSRLQDVLTKKSSFLGSFISIPEIQARNKVLKQCGLPDEEYLVIFTSNYKNAMILVKLTARAFYDDDVTGDNKTRRGRSDNKGLGVVVLDALTRRQWVREEDLAKDLMLNPKLLRRVLRFFEEESLLLRVHRKETAKCAKTEEGKKKMHTYSYCCLDYAQIYDVVRYRLHRMKKKLKDELGERNAIQEYTCPNCKRRYTALDALYLVSFEDDFFHCEHCKGELVESDKLEAEEMGDGDDNARTRRREKIKYMLQKFEEMLRPLMDQLNRVKDLPVPEFKTLRDWEVEVLMTGKTVSNGDASKSYNGTPMPSLGETMVEVALPDVGANAKSEHTSTPTKVLPPWMIKKGMVLTDEQRGEVKQESNMKGASAAADEKNLKLAYLEAYYTAIYQRQQELDTTIDDSTLRQVGMKSKRGYNDDDGGDEDVEWEEVPTAGGTLDLIVEADALGDEEDDIDWEEGYIQSENINPIQLNPIAF